MIIVTKLAGQKIAINEDNIQWIESLPDTVVTFLGGGRLIIKESVERIIALVDEQNQKRNKTEPPSTEPEQKTRGDSESLDL